MNESHKTNHKLVTYKRSLYKQNITHRPTLSQPLPASVSRTSSHRAGLRLLSGLTLSGERHRLWNSSASWRGIGPAQARGRRGEPSGEAVSSGLCGRGEGEGQSYLRQISSGLSLTKLLCSVQLHPCKRKAICLIIHTVTLRSLMFPR